MKDMIYRDDAIALVIKAIHGTDNKEIQNYLWDGLRKQMWSLPSANISMGQTGEWIAIGKKSTAYQCSSCDRCESYKSDFCPNCGAKMNKGDDTE